ncbi:menaquinone-dependent protoporphyrinogen IX dehydrogenase [Serratia microhaemolytica]|uniref:menaquinone-dependent protoporphyrinogen IX dehydrogenase n=1 Tax=Serratia microhaemolytica TaxID=2675110 RepID=UPI000FDDAF7F|nr:menaquinone-dependent protoporphyrinogen IX dehydrogenase [Serratia microhaemolytica]
MKALILYSSRDGQTRIIAEQIAARLRSSRDCDLLDLHQCDDVLLENYQQVVVGASVRYGRFHPTLMKFATRYATQLNQMPTAFFAVNLTARKPDKCSPETNAYTRKFLQQSPWRPQQCAVFAGALRYPRYRWLDRVMIRLIMKMTGGETDTSKEVEYTDWDQVSVFIKNISYI